MTANITMSDIINTWFTGWTLLEQYHIALL